MRNFYTVVLERMKEYDSGFDTEPYECGWASEAMFFIRIHELSGANAELSSKVQVSVDGIEWMDEGTEFHPMGETGSRFIKVRHFGGWLRLSNELRGENPRLKVTVHLVLKE
jgi:hypothetical protein